MMRILEIPVQESINEHNKDLTATVPVFVDVYETV